MMTTARLPNHLATDSHGRIVYRAGFDELRTREVVAEGLGADLVPLLRLDIETGVLDTAAIVVAPPPELAVVLTASRSHQIIGLVNPLPIIDEWGVLSDGSIAILRGADYHIDWISASDQKTTSQSIAYPSRPLSSANKDSIVAAARNRLRSSDSLMKGVMLQTMQRGQGNLVSGPPRAVVDADQLPNRLPAFGPGAVVSDEAARLWVRTPTNAGGGTNDFLIIDRRGQLIDRIRAERGQSIVGFGRDAIYLLSRDGTGLHLVRAALP
jgi:hypothetical protein